MSFKKNYRVRKRESESMATLAEHFSFHELFRDRHYRKKSIKSRANCELQTAIKMRFQFHRPKSLQ
jgi:hypothetical protein